MDFLIGRSARYSKSPYKQVNGMKTLLCKYEYDTILVGMIPNLFLLKKMVAQYIHKKSVKR
jgi:hypothetical protein